MNLMALEIPEDRASLIAWLEEQLVGLHLRQLVGELEILGSSAETSRSLDEVCGDRIESLLRDGISALEQDQIRELLRRPRLLLELQERICCEGGEYWLTRNISAEHQMRADAVWSRVQELVSPKTQPSYSRRTWMLVAGFVLAAAAGIIAITYLTQPTPTTPGWGFDRPGALAENASGPEYLNQLADAAGDWFKKRPSTAAELDQRLREFRRGCETLIAASHRPLSEPSRQWLRERCQACIAKIDAHRLALEQGTRLSIVQAAADNTIQALIQDLKAREATV